MKLPRSLTARIVLAMVSVVVLAGLLTAAITTTQLRPAAEGAQRDLLARQADLLARLPASELAGRSARPGRDLSVGVIVEDGTARGEAAAALDTGLRDRLIAGEPVSTSAEVSGESLLVEARPLREGGAVVLAVPDRNVDAAVARQRRRLMLAVAFGLLGALLVAPLLARAIGRPLAQTATAARRMAAGERGVPLPDAGIDEVADVAGALTHLDAALADSEARQRRFLLSVSHELRTPLTAVRGYAEALADGTVPAEETGEIGQVLVDESERIRRYVDDLLTLARLQEPDFVLSHAPVELGELIRGVETAWRERVERAGHTLEIGVPGHAVPVTTDRGRVRQVLDILLDNAVRVCLPPARIAVTLSAGHGAARIEVRDSGPGLTDEDARVAFDPGALHERYAARAGGQGLGLAIAARLVARLGGTIRVDRAGEGGAAFLIDLPA